MFFFGTKWSGFQIKENPTTKASYGSIRCSFLKTTFYYSDPFFFMLVMFLNIIPLKEADVFEHIWIIMFNYMIILDAYV